MKEKKKQQPTTFKKSSHNSLDWVEKQLRDVRAFDMGLSIHENIENRRSRQQRKVLDGLDQVRFRKEPAATIQSN